MALYFDESGGEVAVLVPGAFNRDLYTLRSEEMKHFILQKQFATAPCSYITFAQDSGANINSANVM